MKSETLFKFYSEGTDVKHKNFSKIIKIHLNNFKGDEYFYIDLNAGPGIYNTYEGSPLRFINQAWQKENIKFNILLIDNNPEFIKRLKFHTFKYKRCSNLNIKIECGDSTETAYKYLQSLYDTPFDNPVSGLIFSDPSGTYQEDLLENLSNNYLYNDLDLLINISGTMYKRLRYKGQRKKISKHLSYINRKYMRVRKPIDGKWKWTLTLLSNNKISKEYNSLDFTTRYSKLGSSIFNEIMYNKEDRFYDDFSERWRKV